MAVAVPGSCICAGSDYSQPSIELARAVAERRGVTNVQWLVDDVLHSSIQDRCEAPSLDCSASDARQLGISSGPSLHHKSKALLTP